MSQRKRIMRFITALSVALGISLVLIGVFEGDPDTLYSLLRLSLSIVSVVSIGILFIQSLQRITKVRESAEQRIRMATIILILFLGVALLAIGAFYDWDRPAPDDAFLAWLGVAIRTVFAFGPAILVWTTPEISDSVTIDADTYGAFSKWKRQKGQVQIDAYEYQEYLTALEKSDVTDSD